MTPARSHQPAPGTAQPGAPAPSLHITGLRTGYGPKAIIEDFTATIPGGRITTIIGPNGCGKSTLLKAAAQLLPTQAGHVTLGEVDLARMRRKELARTISVLPQTPQAQPGVTVADLVARGRHPHQRWINQWSSTDETEVHAALTMTGCLDLATRTIEELSGGQRQRVWISMVLAQNTDVMFLDEPTTYLDLAHSIDILNLVTRLKHTLGRTIVMVLHDLNLAARYSDHLLVMRDGTLMAEGAPTDIITSELLRDVFDLDATIIADPLTGTPLIVPAAPPHPAGDGAAGDTTPAG
ncbi:cobalamin/Fe(3+)-siderophore ABC transporter ATP-binding protein [Corynebacterium sp. 13CS0277]|uniref:ABC transporter ATP-binding protein n=1 Tax=Corynebacterium sp. 13CS0277 TaxID=2071994 RepID=UPI000D03100B|nr:ABC transporter ATP-binding protein [Corynebacterium sp. 13CS0277]PRQ10956.1 cobalamin/Fe(3+)-siderophore ABC transporter ATP-binding protein [Corynebacterium sp. 13CS0277]